jgi:hypothetical protein
MSVAAVTLLVLLLVVVVIVVVTVMVLVVISTVMAAGVVVIAGRGSSIGGSRKESSIGGSRSCRSKDSRNGKSISNKSSGLFILLVKDDISTARLTWHLKRPERSRCFPTLCSIFS